MHVHVLYIYSLQISLQFLKTHCIIDLLCQYVQNDHYYFYRLQAIMLCDYIII